jgi:hypothetical protein
MICISQEDCPYTLLFSDHMPHKMLEISSDSFSIDGNTSMVLQLTTATMIVIKICEALNEIYKSNFFVS